MPVQVESFSESERQDKRLDERKDLDETANRSYVDDSCVVDQAVSEKPSESGTELLIESICEDDILALNVGGERELLVTRSVLT